MDASTAIRTLLPKVPGIGKATISHSLGLSETSSKWDLRTAVKIELLRALVSANFDISVSELQKFSMKDRGIRGKIWISKVAIAAPPEDGIREALFSAIEALKEPGSPVGGYKEPELSPVLCEWTGYRVGATKKSLELHLSEEEKYAEMMKEVNEPTTILYFHGGAHFLMDPCTHRKFTAGLAKLTGGRCLSVRYRLAPQNPFPAGLLDALVCYFSLLYPPANAQHAAVKPQNIVFAGDSAGGNLCFALLQTILEFRRQNFKILWEGIEREVPLNAGVACNSPWLDITQSSPSCEDGRYDYIPARKAGTVTDYSQFRKDSIWPSNPPRNNMYAEDQLLCHPLVSPLAAKSWEGSPPVQFIVGEECLTDENLFVAMKMARQGVTVILDQYEAMPHCFSMVFDETAVARMSFGKWGYFINAAVAKQSSFELNTLQTKGTWITAKKNKEKDLDVLNLSEDTDEIVLERMNRVVHWSNKKVPETMTHPKL